MANEVCELVSFDSYRTGVRKCKRIRGRDLGCPLVKLIYESGEIDIWPPSTVFHNYDIVMHTIKTNRRVIEFHIVGWESYREHVIGPDVGRFRELLLCLADNKCIPMVQIHGWFPVDILTRTIPYIREMYRSEGVHLRQWLAVVDQVIFQKVVGTAPSSMGAPIYRLPWHLPTLRAAVNNFVGRYVAIDPMFYSCK